MTEQLVQLADEAASYFPAQLAKAGEVLDRVAAQRSDDPKVQHNAAITEYLRGGEHAPEKLLATLEKLKQRIDDARAESESGEGTTDPTIGDADPSLTAYNTAIVLYQLKQARAAPAAPAHPRDDGPAAAARPPHPRARPPAAARAARRP